MQLTERTRKYILLGIIIFIVVGLITAKVFASKQDKDFLTEDMLYQQASQLYQAGNNADALTAINALLLKQPNSAAVNNLGGLIISDNGDYKQGAILLQKTMDLNPYKVEDPIFMLQFAEVLFFAERLDDAKIVLEQCRESTWVPESYPTYQERVTELLSQIESQQ